MPAKIPNQDRLIVALDFPTIQEAKNLVNELGDAVSFYKIGLELCMGGEYFELVEWLGEKNKKIFADVKLFDIAATVGKAVKNLSQYKHIKFVTIHAASKEIMNHANANKGHIQLLAVTVLTCLDNNDLADMGFDPALKLEELVIKKAVLAKDCAIDGVISSGLEATNIRNATNDNFLIITPGIRLEEAVTNDDQKRVVNVKTAFKNGADYIVVGRPVNKAANPKQVAQQIQQEINSVFNS